MDHPPGPGRDPGSTATASTAAAPGPAPAGPREPFRLICKEPDGGTGLGLSIAQSVAIAHGAQLDVLNQPEGGLSISLTLRA